MSSVRLPSYLVPSSLKFDRSSGELYAVAPVTCQSNDDIARRLSRNTEASSSKLFKWQRHEPSRRRRAVVVDRSPMFEAVSRERADSIADRLSRPTRATALRRGQPGAADADSTTGTQRTCSAASRSSVTSKASRKSLVAVPRPSARPQRPILVDAADKRSRHDVSDARVVRFQSPLPIQKIAPGKAERTKQDDTRAGISGHDDTRAGAAISELSSKCKTAPGGERVGNTATADAQGRTATADAQGRTATADAQGSTATADAQGSTATADAQGRTATADAPGRTATADAQGSNVNTNTEDQDHTVRDGTVRDDSECDGADNSNDERDKSRNGTSCDVTDTSSAEMTTTQDSDDGSECGRRPHGSSKSNHQNMRLVLDYFSDLPPE